LKLLNNFSIVTRRRVLGPNFKMSVSWILGLNASKCNLSRELNFDF